MAFIRGKDIDVFMTTENTTVSIICTGSSPDVTNSATVGVGAASSLIGVGKLGGMIGSPSTIHKMKFVEGIDPSTTWEEEVKPFVGGQRDYNLPYRKKWELSITRITEDKMFQKLAMAARHGAAEAGTLHTGLSEMVSTSGYRVYLYDGNEYTVLYHGVIPGDGYSKAIDPTKAVVETIRLTGNEWSASVPTASLSTIYVED